MDRYRPASGYARSLDHFLFRTLEHLRQHLSRRSISYHEFRIAVLPCLELLFAACLG